MDVLQNLCAFNNNNNNNNNNTFNSSTLSGGEVGGGSGDRFSSLAPPTCSLSVDERTTITFQMPSNNPRLCCKLFWIDSQGSFQLVNEISGAGNAYTHTTYVGSLWVLTVIPSGVEIGRYMVQGRSALVQVPDYQGTDIEVNR